MPKFTGTKYHINQPTKLSPLEMSYTTFRHNSSVKGINMFKRSKESALLVLEVLQLWVQHIELDKNEQTFKALNDLKVQFPAVTEQTSEREWAELVYKLKSLADHSSLLDKNGKSLLHDLDFFNSLPAHLQNKSDTCYQLLIELGMNLNLTDKNKSTPLFYAVTTSNHSKLKLLLETKTDQPVTIKDREWALGTACAMDNLDMIDLLIKAGVKVENIVCLVGTSSLVVDNPGSAITHVSAHSYERIALLHLAIKDGDKKCGVKIVQAYFDQHPQAQINSTVHIENYFPFQPLYEAALFGNTKVVEFLLNKGADPRTKDDGRSTLDMVKKQLKHVDDPAYQQKLTEIQAMLHKKDLELHPPKFTVKLLTSCFSFGSSARKNNQITPAGTQSEPSRPKTLI